MRRSILYLLAACSTVAAVMASSAVWAGIAPPVNVPEPGVAGIVAAGVASVLLVARLSRRSK